jgi:hypothetical protein
MNIQEVKEAMSAHDIHDETEAVNAVEFVERLLTDEIEDCKENHPHATNTLMRLQYAKEMVTNLYHEIYVLDFKEVEKK